MTTNDPIPYPPGEPEEIGQLFAEVFDLVDAEVDAIPDEHVSDRLQQLLWDSGYVDPAEPAGIGIVLGGARGGTTDLGGLIEGVHVARELEQARCALRAVQEEVAQAEARAQAVREEADTLRAAAQRMMREALQARQHAEDTRAGADAYVDAALDRALDIVAEAQARAGHIIAEADQQAEVITAAAQAHTRQHIMFSTESDGLLVDRPFRMVVVGHGRVGKPTLAHVRRPDVRTLSAPSDEVDLATGQAPAEWRAKLTAALARMPAYDRLLDVDISGLIEPVLSRVASMVLLSPVQGSGFSRLLVAGAHPDLFERVERAAEIIMVHGRRIPGAAELFGLSESVHALASCPTPDLIARAWRAGHYDWGSTSVWWTRVTTSFTDLHPSADEPVRHDSVADTAREVADAVHEVAELCGGLPLAIRCIAERHSATPEDDEPGLALRTADRRG